LEFAEVLRIFPINTIVNIYNSTYLEVLNSPAFIILVTNDPPSIKVALYINTSNLYNRFSLIISSKIIFIENF
ncbi:hypothetical protein QBC45DRAFT_340034, partial [Copromyces sp. CBS 386.78]